MTKKEITKSLLNNNVCQNCANVLFEYDYMNNEVQYGYICPHSPKRVVEGVGKKIFAAWLKQDGIKRID
jgi:hypothetical protein